MVIYILFKPYWCRTKTNMKYSENSVGKSRVFFSRSIKWVIFFCEIIAFVRTFLFILGFLLTSFVNNRLYQRFYFNNLLKSKRKNEEHSFFIEKGLKNNIFPFPPRSFSHCFKYKRNTLHYGSIVGPSFFVLEFLITLVY